MTFAPDFFLKICVEGLLWAHFIGKETGFNRTMMELKFSMHNCPFSLINSFNRTMMELKLYLNTSKGNNLCGFNRTMMELKFS